MFGEYILLFFYFFMCFFFVMFLLSCSILFVRQNPSGEKLSSYECGFNPFEDARTKFEVSFFLVGILFLVFDLELAFLLPWAIICTVGLSMAGFYFFMFFLIVFIFSFFMEWYQGALNWE